MNSKHKYPLNQWTPTVLLLNGKQTEVLIKPYRNKKGKIAYLIKKRQYHDGDKYHDCNACTHSELVRTEFDVQDDGIDIPKSGTEIKETRQNTI